MQKKKSELILRTIKQSGLQYVFIRPISTAIGIALMVYGIYCPGNLSPKYGYLYITVVVFISVSIALYGLIALYKFTHECLEEFHPLLKFLAIKFVIFFSFWQSIVVAGLVKIGVVHKTTYWTADNVATGIEDFLICFEMLIASIIHLYAYPYKEFVGIKIY